MREVLKSSAHSSSNKLAGAITKVIEKGNNAEVHAIGAGAVNQTVKAIAIARGHLTLTGRDITCVPLFLRVETGEQDVTAIRMLIDAKLEA